MPSAWVVDASPLIVLARVGQLSRLERLAPQALIPSAVDLEVRSGPTMGGWRGDACLGQGRVPLVEQDVPGKVSVSRLAVVLVAGCIEEIGDQSTPPRRPGWRRRCCSFSCGEASRGPVDDTAVPDAPHRLSAEVRIDECPSPWTSSLLWVRRPASPTS